MSLGELRSLPWWINTAWMWQCRREAEAFRAAARTVRDTQEQLLRSTLSDNAQSLFGREHGFASIRSFDDYRSAVPIANYDTIAARIDRIASGEQQVLTAEPVLMFEPTGGSTGGSKLIPYTAALRRQFQRAVSAWIWDVLRHRPAVRAGTAYWSISPAVQRSQRQTSGGTRIGFDSDREYLGGLQRWAVSHLLVVPPEVSQLSAIENFRYVTLGYLLAAEDLALISIWSPTFLTALLDALPAWGDRLCGDLHDGRFRLPFPDQEPVVPRLKLPRMRRRSRELARVLGAAASAPTSCGRIWPGLALISCWADAAAEMYVPQLHSRFPGALLQPKGLLATEGVVSIPVVGQPGAALAIRSHVFEFLENCDGGQGETPSRTLLADELEVKRRYRVLLTTGGGLYRYDLGDVVEVVGFLGACPLLRFRGRHGSGSDLVGEKLNERHVRECLRLTFDEFGVRPEFSLVVPQAVPPGYLVLVVCASPIDTNAITAGLVQRLESRLRENPQYRYAVDLGQLRPIGVRWLELPEGRAWQIYEERCRQLGQKAGDIKPTALDGRQGWEEVFC